MTNRNCRHCNAPIEPAPAYLGVAWQHTSGYQHCLDRGSFLGTKADPCCDGTGFTGDPHERCVIHYEPLDAIWFAR